LSVEMNIDLIESTPSVALADVARKLKMSGVHVIELQTGDPDFSTPVEIIEAANSALLNGRTHYSFSAGIPELRDRIAEQINGEFSLALSRSNVVITHGAVQGIAAVVNALVELRDEVIILEPNWTTLDSLVTLAGGAVIKLSHMVEDDHLFASLEKARTKRTRMLCFNSPNNPSGAVFSAHRVKLLIDWAKKHDLYVLSDEVYRSITFDCDHASVMNHFGHASKIIFIDSFSKRFAMTGWRIGYLVADTKLIERIAKASQVMVTNIAPFIQYAALEALSSASVSEQVSIMKSVYGQRRKYLMEACHRLGLEVLYPQGAFYLFLRVTEDDVLFARRLLDEHHVCAVPGSAYGVSGKGWLRVTYAASEKVVEAGLQKIASLLKDCES
jgi:aspartate aminotransferase